MNVVVSFSFVSNQRVTCDQARSPPFFAQHTPPEASGASPASAAPPPPPCPHADLATVSSSAQRVEEELAAALEDNHSLLKLTVELRSTRARDLSAKLLLRNQDEARARARAAAASGAAAPPPAAAPPGPGLDHSVLARPKDRWMHPTC